MEIQKGAMIGDLDTKDFDETRELKSDDINAYKLSKGIDSFKSELGYDCDYDLDVEKYEGRPLKLLLDKALVRAMIIAPVELIGVYLLVTTKDVLSLETQGFILSILTVYILLGLQWVIQDYTHDKNGLEEVRNLKNKYELYKVFYPILKDSKPLKEVDSVLEELNKNGISILIDILNQTYVLEDGFPIKLYESLELNGNKIVVTEDLYELPKEEKYKELLMSGLTEEGLVSKVNSYNTQYKNYQEGQKIKETVTELRKEEDRRLKALKYSKEYNKKLKERLESQKVKTKELPLIEEELQKYIKENVMLRNKLKK